MLVRLNNGEGTSLDYKHDLKRFWTAELLEPRPLTLVCLGSSFETFGNWLLAPEY